MTDKNPQTEMDRWRVEFDRCWRALRYADALADLTIPHPDGPDKLTIYRVTDLLDDLQRAHQRLYRWEREHTRIAIESATKAAVAPINAVLDLMADKALDKAVTEIERAAAKGTDVQEAIGKYLNPRIRGER